MEFVRGLVVRSAAGRDKGTFLVVLSENEQRAAVCDGRRRPLERAKYKNKKHLFVTGTVLPEGAMKTNRGIRRALQSFLEEDGQAAISN